MKRLIVGFCVVFFLLLTQPRTFALSYVDDFTDGSSGNVKSYYGLVPASFEAQSWSFLPDRSAFTFSNMANPFGYAVYSARYAQKITVGLYTLSGSFASYAGSIDTWVLGMPGEQAAVSELMPVYYSPSTGFIYAYIDNEWRLAEVGEFATVFKTPVVPPGDLVKYAVNALASQNGLYWENIALTQSSLIFKSGSPLVYEERSGVVPAGTRYLRIELNDVSRLPIYGQPDTYAQKVQMGFNSLASVTISGENLLIGKPEPVIRESTVSDTEESEEEQSSEQESSQSKSTSKSSANSSQSGGESSGGGSESSAASSYDAPKFEGIIESSSKLPGQAAPSSSPEKSVPPPQAPSESEALLPVGMNEPPLYGDDTIYRIGSAEDDDNHFTAGVTMYIIVVTGALAFIVVASAIRGK